MDEKDGYGAEKEQGVVALLKVCLGVEEVVVDARCEITIDFSVIGRS